MTSEKRLKELFLKTGQTLRSMKYLEVKNYVMLFAVGDKRTSLKK